MKSLPNISEWENVFSKGPTGEIGPWLLKNYGADASRIQDRCSKFSLLIREVRKLDVFDQTRSIVLGRTPCRARVFGGHTDFKGLGGYLINLAGNLEMIYAGQERKDRRIVLRNENPDLKACEFSLEDPDVKPGETIRTPEDWDRWCMQVEKKKKENFQREIEKMKTDQWEKAKFNEEWTRLREKNWQDFVKGILAYLQTDLGDPSGKIRQSLCGFTAFFRSEVPMGWGLSSSSAVVMSVALLANALFDLKLSSDEIISLGLCEHYNGTKGGMNDHASIIKGVHGRILLMRSFPEQVIDNAEFPKGVSLFLADSKVKRSQAPTLSAKFKREGIADAAVVLARTGIGYALASLWVRHQFAEYREALKPRPGETNDTNGLLREFNQEGKIPFASSHDRSREIYRILKSIPERTTREELKKEMPEFQAELEALFVTHPEPLGGYHLRGMALFGLAENERTFEYVRCANAGDFQGMLELMRIAHDGDRVAQTCFDSGDREREEIYEYEAGNQRLDLWMKNPAEHPLWKNPGFFERSIEPVDRLCDLIDHRFGQEATGRVAGAGLGGAVAILARTDSVEKIRNFLLSKGYPSIPPLVPSAGASVVTAD